MAFFLVQDDSLGLASTFQVVHDCSEPSSAEQRAIMNNLKQF